MLGSYMMGKGGGYSSQHDGAPQGLAELLMSMQGVQNGQNVPQQMMKQGQQGGGGILSQFVGGGGLGLLPMLLGLGR